jgi:hypothetical protein
MQAERMISTVVSIGLTIFDQPRAIILLVDAVVLGRPSVTRAIHTIHRSQLLGADPHEMIEVPFAQLVHRTPGTLAMTRTCLLGVTIRHNKSHTRGRRTNLASVQTDPWVLHLRKQRIRTGQHTLVLFHSRVQEPHQAQLKRLRVKTKHM